MPLNVQNTDRRGNATVNRQNRLRYARSRCCIDLKFSFWKPVAKQHGVQSAMPAGVLFAAEKATRSWSAALRQDFASARRRRVMLRIAAPTEDVSFSVAWRLWAKDIYEYYAAIDHLRPMLLIAASAPEAPDIADLLGSPCQYLTMRA